VPHVARLIVSPNHRQNRPHPVPIRGAFRHRHGRWARDAVDAMVSKGERHQSGRRSRVVLMPRRRHQVCSQAMSALTGPIRRASDGDKKARSPGRSRSRPLKPLRGECRLNPSVPVVTTLVRSLFRARGCGCNGHPAFPAPSIFSRDRLTHDSDVLRREKADICLPARRCDSTLSSALVGSRARLPGHAGLYIMSVGDINRCPEEFCLLAEPC
jgi:hypothetical protein